MSSPLSNPRAPFLSDLSQFKVDFVIPRSGVDIPLGIDPFLLYKSRNPLFAALHSIVLKTFNAGIEALRRRERSSACYLFDLPEVSEVGLGYTKKGKRGSGVGDFLAALIVETLEDSPALMERGVRHIEEMQLVSIGIGPDRISDMTANLLKQFLIDYTQKQCALWHIPLRSGVPLHHLFDPERCAWYDDYVDLPVSPIDGHPILLVPRRLVRALPWINYDDYFHMEFSTYLRAKRVRGKLQTSSHAQGVQSQSKQQVVAVTRAQVERIDHYINVKEQGANQAQPSVGYLPASEICQEAESLKTKLADIPSGTALGRPNQPLIVDRLLDASC
jgi:hypothetical protein